MTDAIAPLPPEKLRWRCPSLPFETTRDVQSELGVVGQASAMEALRFGLECTAPGQNVFVRGIPGTGRMSLIRRLLAEMQPPCAARPDRCYVRNFSRPDQPRLITLPAGRAREFRRRVHELAEFIRDRLGEAMRSDALRARQDSLERRAAQELQALTAPFETSLKEAGLALVTVHMGPMAHLVLLPVIDGEPVTPEEYEKQRAEGKISDERHQAFLEAREAHQKQLDELADAMRVIRRRSLDAIRDVLEEAARSILGGMASAIQSAFPGEDVKRFLSEVIEDVVEARLAPGTEEREDPLRRYSVNILYEQGGEPCPVVVESSPSLQNLLGSVDREWGSHGPMLSDHSMIRAGSILRADGGYLILDARDLLGEPGAWKALVRTLRTGKLEIVPPDLFLLLAHQNLKPEPIPVQVRVVLIGNSELYRLLDRFDPDFGELFKVLADFDTVIDREPDGPAAYAGVVARIARDEDLPPFHSSAVAALVEHGARLGAHRGKLSACFSRIADVAREAGFLARKDQRELVGREDVDGALRRARARAELPARRFLELVRDGTLKVQVTGSVVGQVNGLAVISAGPIVYGFPGRITASIGAGSAGIIDIEGEAALSGAFHRKGFYILGGLLRRLLQTDHPLAFSASLGFEQSYGFIDGDSASAAEICCLLSALTDVPIRQGIAITGAIDQIGHVMAIGAVNEKVEGFFDVCAALGLTGDQGVVVPMANAGDLMLRADLVEACAKGSFRVWAVDTIQEALELLTGVPAGHRQASGDYPADTLLARAMDRAHEFWRRSLQSPPENGVQEEEEEEEESAPEVAGRREAGGSAETDRAASRSRRRGGRYQR